MIAKLYVGGGFREVDSSSRPYFAGFIDSALVTGVEPPSRPRRGIPGSFILEQNYPNPFNPITTIHYQLPTASHTSLKVFNVLGQLVTTLVDEEQSPGYKWVRWNASNVASGVYFYRLEATSLANPGKVFVQTKKMVLLK